MAGAGYKLFNTGDVLTAAQVNTYLMEQTVMVFADAAARTAALSGVVSEGMISYLKDTNAVEVYNGSAWVASDDPNAIQNTIVDAKGDLITATAADTPARLAVGNNGETLVADSSASTGLRWQPSQAAGRNILVNGSMDVWQRGTSFTSGGYTADRWYSNINSSFTISRQATSDTTNLPNIQYCLRFARNSGQTSTTAYSLSQPIETVNSIPFAGQQVTFSFYARRGANFSGASNQISVYLFSGTGTDQNYVVGGYTGANGFINNQKATLTTTWQRFTYQGTVPATATELQPFFESAWSGTAGANDWFEITGVQLELGSVATSFTRTGGTLAGELAACQRYYWRISGAEKPNVGLSTVGLNGATTPGIRRAMIYLPVSMRVGPSVAIVGSGVRILNSGLTQLAAPPTINFNASGSNFISLDLNITTAGTAGQIAYFLIDSSSANDYVEASAEL